jgi:hypothetical protein
MRRMKTDYRLRGSGSQVGYLRPCRIAAVSAALSAQREIKSEDKESATDETWIDTDSTERIIV